MGRKTQIESALDYIHPQMEEVFVGLGLYTPSTQAVLEYGEPLSYGVTFSEATLGSLSSLDWFIKDHSCFSGFNFNNKNNLDWTKFGPKVDNYNHFLAKAIARGTGQIVKGIFMCSNAYTNKLTSSLPNAPYRYINLQDIQMVRLLPTKTKSLSSLLLSGSCCIYRLKTWKLKPPQHCRPPPLHLHPHQPLLHRRNLHLLLHGKHLPPPLLHLIAASLSASNGSGTNPPPSAVPFLSTPKAASLPCMKVNMLKITNECDGGRNAAMKSK
ncbi:uncharacterized protein HKW66_Vig0171830 [Vigna angularis]|uniref:Uncharacterized protein n=1 Tax=Phaseolus angularis TaxID=3914 RepID=A0A8T0JQR1_PHAAN|nr:uncharacterized protein HKW66_Vig0171830 [Vigna angularis]